VIAADSRARGKSTDPGEVLNYEMMADDFAALLTHLKIYSAYVIGWSDGGNNALLMPFGTLKKLKKWPSLGPI
jgi:pimeloyl-ACP methyl ester carboxylesterase